MKGKIDPLAALAQDRAWTIEICREALARKGAERSCEACGGANWGIASDVAVVGTLDPSGHYVAGRGVDAVMVFCRRCGLLRLHAASVLFRDP
jgi:ribosomal protein L40E